MKTIQGMATKGMHRSQALPPWRHALTAALLALAAAACSDESGLGNKGDAGREVGAPKNDAANLGLDGPKNTDLATVGDLPLADVPITPVDGGGTIDGRPQTVDGGRADVPITVDAAADAPTIDTSGRRDTTPAIDSTTRRDTAPADTRRGCGAAGEECCAGSVCLNGGCCEQLAGGNDRCIATGAACSPAQGGGTCAAGRCTSDASICGGLGDECCGAGTCTAGNVVCATSSGPDRCVACGGLNERCCGTSGNRSCTAAGTTCNSSLSNPTCVACGGVGQPCCTNEAGDETCNAGATCNTSGSRTGVCEACGIAGGDCCPDNSCAGGGCCIGQGSNGTCVAGGGACPGSAGICRSGACVGDAGSCGGTNNRCCDGTGSAADYCTAPNVVCARGDDGMSCEACGAADQRCCEGRYCKNGLSCSGGGADATCQ